MEDFYYIPVPAEELARERAKAREIRRSMWWKNQLGKGVCYYCKRRFHPSELTMDHIVPLARGGKSIRSNVVPCCKECNSAKQSKLPSEWQEYLDRLAAGT